MEKELTKINKDMEKIEEAIDNNPWRLVIGLGKLLIPGPFKEILDRILGEEKEAAKIKRAPRIPDLSVPDL